MVNNPIVVAVVGDRPQLLPLLAIPVGDALWDSSSSFFFLFFFFFFCHDLVRAISLERSFVETPDSVCCLVLQSNFALLLTIQFASLFFFSFFLPRFYPGHISGTVTRRLQIECAAWSCGLILHCCLPSNSLCYFFFRHDFATILSGPYLWNHYSQRLQTECAAWSCGLILHYCLPSNLLRYFFCFAFATMLSGPYLWNCYSQRLQIEYAAWSCGLILHCCLPSNSLCYFFFPPRFCPAQSLSSSGDRSSVAYRATENLSRYDT